MDINLESVKEKINAIDSKIILKDMIVEDIAGYKTLYVAFDILNICNDYKMEISLNYLYESDIFRY